MREWPSLYLCIVCLPCASLGMRLAWLRPMRRGGERLGALAPCCTVE